MVGIEHEDLAIHSLCAAPVPFVFGRAAIWRRVDRPSGVDGLMKKGFDNRPMKGLLGSFLRKHREEAGLTQRALGEELGVSHVTVGEWERGVRTVPARHRYALCDRYSVAAPVMELIAIIDRQELINLAGHEHARIAVSMVAEENLCRLEADQLAHVCEMVIAHGQIT